MPNGIKVPTEDVTELTTDSGVRFQKCGNVITMVCNGSYIDANGLIEARIPSNMRPPVAVYPTCFVTRSSGQTPSHALAYATLNTNGNINIVEPYNGSYRIPAGAYAYIVVTWLI